MKFRLIFIVVCCFLFLVPYLIYQRHMHNLRAPDVAPVLFENAPQMKLTTMADTKSMAEAFQKANEPIYLAHFPSDFASQGTPELFVQALLPYIHFYNQQVMTDRQQLIAIANKLWAHQSLTQAETERFFQLEKFYDVTGEADAGTAFHLLEKINVIPPTVALAVALEETKGGKEYLDAPFGVFVWDDNKRYVRASYPDLSQAYYAWFYQLNTADAHASFREMRQQWVSPKPYVGYFLLKHLRSLRPYDENYTDILSDTYTKYQLLRLEEKDEENTP